MNVCIFIGEVCKEGERTVTNSGHTMCRFGIHVRKNEKEKIYVPCTAWSALIQQCMELRKGDVVAVTGSYTSRRVENPNSSYGYDYFHSIQANKVQHIEDALKQVAVELFDAPEGAVM